jgi:signal peptidase I
MAEQPGDTDKTSGLGRRTLAFFLSLAQPGAGHFLLGHFRRGIAWAVALPAAVLVLVVAAPIHIVFMLVALLVSYGGLVACATDVTRLTVARPRWALVLVGWAALVAGTFVLAPIKDYYRENRAQAFTIPAGSMMNTLLVGDYILVDKAVYRARAPRRGDVVVFKYPVDERRDFIKRIVGTAGETIQVRGQQVLINGAALEEPYVLGGPPGVTPAGSSPSCPYAYACEPVVVPPDSYFVLGDNRDNSQDSRYWGFVKRDKIKGKAVQVYWSWDSQTHWLRWWRLGQRVS